MVKLQSSMSVKQSTLHDKNKYGVIWAEVHFIWFMKQVVVESVFSVSTGCYNYIHNQIYKVYYLAWSNILQNIFRFPIHSFSHIQKEQTSQEIKLKEV